MKILLCVKARVHYIGMEKSFAPSVRIRLKTLFQSKEISFSKNEQITKLLFIYFLAGDNKASCALMDHCYWFIQKGTLPLIEITFQIVSFLTEMEQISFPQ